MHLLTVLIPGVGMGGGSAATTATGPLVFQRAQVFQAGGQVAQVFQAGAAVALVSQQGVQ